MARGTITPGQVTRAGLDRSTNPETVGNVATGHTIPNRGMMWIDVHNTNASSTAHTLTVHIPGSKDGQGITPRTWSIAAGKTVSLGLWPTDIYSGNLLVDVDNAELHITAWELVA